MIVSEDGDALDFGSGMDFALWESASITDAADTEDDAGDAVETDEV